MSEYLAGIYNISASKGSDIIVLLFTFENFTYVVVLNML